MPKRFPPAASLLAICVLAIGIVYPAYAADKEQQVKAAFLYNFTKFTSWPSPIDLPSMASINICVLGTNTLDDAIEIIEKGSTATLKISARQISLPPTRPGECHVVFVSQSMAGNISNVLAQMANSQSLTVSDVDGFVDKGGMVGFVKLGNKIRLYINKGAVDAASLKLDGQLLEIADKVLR